MNRGKISIQAALLVVIIKFLPYELLKGVLNRNWNDKFPSTRQGKQAGRFLRTPTLRSGG